MPLRKFELSEPALADMEQSGLDTRLVNALRHQEVRGPLSREQLLEVLGRATRKPVTPQEKRVVLRHARLGLLRLERFIPHRGTREWVEAALFALVVALVVRTFLFAPFKIPSGSMIPTIEVGDHIFATMYSYGIPVPFTQVKLFPQEIERGDIVIFPYPLDPSIDYIKRVIARGGETVEVRGTQVLVDGRPLDEPYAVYDPGVMAQRERDGAELLRYGPVRVPEGHLFEMGDNRLNSSDSRVWGFVDARTVKGEGQIIYWSHDPHAGLLGGYRWGRIGTLLE